MPWRLQSEPSTVERVVGGLSYLTAGIAGLVYMLLGKGGAQSTQFRFHAFQAMFITILMVICEWGGGFMQHLLVPLFFLFGAQVGATMSMVVGACILVLTKAFWLLLLYGAVMAFLGKFAEVPIISNVIHHNMRA